MNILFLSQWLPYPPDNGSKIRIYQILRGLAARHEITLVSFADPGSPAVDRSPLAAICQEIHRVPWKPYNSRSARAVMGYLSLKPRYVVDTLSAEMEAVIRRLVSERKFDLVIASQMGMAGYAAAFQGLPALLEEVELGVFSQQYHLENSPIRRLRHGLTWFKQRRYIAHLLKSFRAATVVSRQEQKLLNRTAPGFQPVEVIPNFIDVEDYKRFHTEPRPNSLVFSGSLKFHPNEEAMQWFLAQVYPRVAESLPGVRLTITGDTGGKTLPNAGAVIQTGYLEDARPCVASAWASLAPIQTGGGTRLKILDAMALKTPVITTTRGAEGLEVQNGKHLLIADTPEAYGQAVLRLLQEPGLRRELADNAYELVCEKYSPAAVMPRLLECIEQAVGNGASLVRK